MVLKMSPKQGKHQKTQKSEQDAGSAQLHLTQTGTISAPQITHDKPKPPAVQAKPKEDDFSSYTTEKLISLAFDEHPKVRIKVVQELAKRPEDTTAVFGLLELCTDKDESVKNLAKYELANIEGDQNANTLEKLFLEKKVEDADINTVRAKLMPSIEKLFTKKDGKSHMETSIQKLFTNVAKNDGAQAGTGALLELPSVGEPAQTAHGNEMAESKEDAAPKKMFQASDSVLDKAFAENELEEKKRHAKPLPIQPEISKDVEERQIESISYPAEESASSAKNLPDSAVPADKADETGAAKSSDIYSKAVLIAKKPGITEKDLKNEEKKIMARLKQEVKDAFLQAREMLTVNRDKSVRDLKIGMQKINTVDMNVRSCDKVEINKGKKMTYVYRIEIEDKTGVCVMYVQENKGKGLEQGDTIKITNCNYEKNMLTGEDCLTLAPKSKLIISR